MEVDVNELKKRFPKKYFDNKNVLVVDEETLTGDSIKLARDYLRDAFPEIVKIKGLSFATTISDPEDSLLLVDPILPKQFIREGSELVEDIPFEKGYNRHSELDIPLSPHFFTRRKQKPNFTRTRQFSQFGKMSSAEILKRIEEGKYEPLLQK